MLILSITNFTWPSTSFFHQERMSYWPDIAGFVSHDQNDIHLPSSFCQINNLVIAYQDLLLNSLPNHTLSWDATCLIVAALHLESWNIDNCSCLLCEKMFFFLFYSITGYVLEYLTISNIQMHNTQFYNFIVFEIQLHLNFQ